MKERIKVYLYNKTMKEIDMSDFSYISEDVFSERTDIVKVVLPEGVKEIGNNAFENCIHLEEVVCPKSLQKIDSEAFIDCISLKKIDYDTASVKVDASAFKVADIYKTKVCPLAKVMRRELKKRGVKKLKVVYSEEQPTRPIEDMAISCRTNCICPPGAEHKCTERRDIPGSVAFVPSVAGLIIAGEVVKDLCRK
mgnify:FL=1